MVRYPVDVKLEAVRMFLEEGRTRAEITKVLGLRSEGRVKIWVWQYRRDGQAAFQRDKKQGQTGTSAKAGEHSRLYRST